jgi:hypothetical protein
MPGKRRRFEFVRDLFFWMGVACAAASICVVCTSNTSLISQFERQGAPLSWLLAGLAMVSLVIAEQLHLATTATRDAAREARKPVPPKRSPKAVSPMETETHAEVFPHRI